MSGDFLTETQCVICGEVFDNTPRSNLQTYRRKTCSEPCSIELQKRTQIDLYNRMRDAKEDIQFKTAREKIAFAVYNVIESSKISGKPKKFVHRNDMEVKILSIMPELSNYSEKFRRKCITKSMQFFGYEINNHHSYDIVFKYINK